MRKIGQSHYLLNMVGSNTDCLFSSTYFDLLYIANATGSDILFLQSSVVSDFAAPSSLSPPSSSSLSSSLPCPMGSHHIQFFNFLTVLTVKLEEPNNQILYDSWGTEKNIHSHRKKIQLRSSFDWTLSTKSLLSNQN